MANTLTMVNQPSGATAWFEYNANNLRIQRVGYNNPTPFSIHVTVWIDGAIVYDDLLPTGTNTRNVPGSITLQTEQDEAGTVLLLPSNVEYRLQWPA